MWGAARLALWCVLITVPPSQPQAPLPLALPARVSVEAPWSSLPLSQSHLGLLFSNSSPFSFSQPLLLLPPAGPASAPGAQASFGPYSVTQLVSEPLLPLSSPLRASLLSEYVERAREEGGRERAGEEGGRERFRVRALFRVRGGGASQRGGAGRGVCVTLHAFRETEEHTASCITQPPLGLCIVTLTLPQAWFRSNQDGDDDPGPASPAGHAHHRLRSAMRRHRRHGNTGWLGRGRIADRVQLYYSSFGTVADPKLAPPRCVEEKRAEHQRQLFYAGAVTLRGAGPRRTNEDAGCLNGQEEEELQVDPNVLIRYHRGPVRAGRPIGVSVNVRANFSAEFVVIRLKVKRGLVSLVAQRSSTSDLWAVTMETSQGSKHDIISIVCHKRRRLLVDLSPSSLHRVACLSVDGLRRSFGVAMTVWASWWVEYSGRNNPPPPHGGALSSFSFTDREVVGIVPLTESDAIINTAILTSEPVSLPVMVLAVGHDGKVSDVTSAVRCQSSNEDIVKVSSDCSALFVDGSESGEGSTCVGVAYLLGTLRGSVCLAVWAPVVPLRLSLSDPELNAIQGWSHNTARGCSPVFQRSTVEVLTQFVAKDNQGHLTYLLGSPDWLVDMTEVVRNWLRVENPRIATLDKQGNLIGLQPGKTSLHIVSSQWDGVLGSCDVTVTSDPVVPGDLSVQVVSGLGMSIEASPAHPSIVTATVTAYNILYDPGQEATVSVWLQFGDDSASLLSAFRGVPFSLRLSSLAPSVVAVTPGPSQRVVARGDGGGPLLQAELLVPVCGEPVASNAVVEGDGEGGGTRRLAKGSGWIRVNLDSELRPMGSEEADFDFDMADTLTEARGDIYGDSFGGDDVADGNATGTPGNAAPYERWAGAGEGGLERAALWPDQEESVVYLSPGVERERRRDEERRSGRGERERRRDDEERSSGRGEREVGIGVGAVLALLCLSTLLFLVNCLPCTLRERRGRRKGAQEEEEERGEMDEEVVREVEREVGKEKEEKEEEEEEQRGIEAQETAEKMLGLVV